jgi:hypothetical protein
VALLEQRDQVVAHLQQYCAGYQTLASEREQLHLQYLQQAQLMDRLQHDENEGRVQLEISHQQLRHAQVSHPWVWVSLVVFGCRLLTRGEG